MLEKKKLTKYKPLSPLPYQEGIIKKIKRYYKKNDYGRLYLPCGTGKTFLGYWTFKKILKCKNVFIVVPSLYLLSETYETWQKELQNSKSKYHFILIGSDMDKKKGLLCEYKPTTCIKNIKLELKKHKRVVAITTYQSSELLVNACKELKHTFDLGIFDEAHRTVGETNKQFTCLLSRGNNISKKRLFMTATEKIYYYSKSKLTTLEQQEKILSMDKKKIYGKIIHNYSTRRAIEDSEGKNYGLVDYKVVAPFVSTDKYDDMIENNGYIRETRKTYSMKTILTGLMIIMAMKECKFTHLLIFSNKNKRAKELIEVVEKILEHEGMNDVYCKFLSGNDNMTIRRSEVKKFEKSRRGIISSARIFGEGVNIKICDAVCFADNKGSIVDIIQNVGRCLRKCKDIKPNKTSYVLVPIILNNEDDNLFDSVSKSYYKLRQVLKSLGNTDELITERFTLMDCNNTNTCINDCKMSEPTIKIGNKININELKEHIISKIFDRSGDPESRWRRLLNNENKRRHMNNEELIDTKDKCMKFFRNNGIYNTPNVQNWIKYCLGNTLFEEIKKQYYYTKEDILEACREIEIYDFTDYKKLYVKDKMLASVEYINNGFYIDMDPKFNLSIMLESLLYDCDF